MCPEVCNGTIEQISHHVIIAKNYDQTLSGNPTNHLLYNVIITGSSLMASNPLEQLSFAQQLVNNPTQLENGVKEMNNKAVVIAFMEAFNNRNSSALDSLVAQNVTEHRPGIQSGLNTYKQFLNSMI